MRPQQRQDDLIIKDLGNEILVYDLNRNKAHNLSSTAGLVFQLCDGDHDLALLAGEVAKARGVTTDEAVALVEVALEQLSHRGLLIESVARAPHEYRLTRRKLLQTMATAAVALPFIVSLPAPTAAQAISAGCVAAGGTDPSGCVGGHSSVCCSGNCITFLSGLKCTS